MARCPVALACVGEAPVAFADFQGLRACKDDLDPVRELRYVASPGGVALPGMLTGISSPVSGGLKGIPTR